MSRTHCTKPIRLKPSPSNPEGLLVPCGKCLACRMSKRREWSARLAHESDYWDKSMFLTLTYADRALPPNASLRKADLQRFIKLLRGHKDREGQKIKYFACGEYGTKTQRPHYHLILFGVGFEDKDLISYLWPHADWHVPEIAQRAFGVVERDSIRYVCQYIDDKLSGEMADEEYVNKGREPVFKIGSNGLGLRYANNNSRQLTDNLWMMVDGVRMSLPRYYVDKLQIDREELGQAAKDAECDMIEAICGEHITFDDAYKELTTGEVLAISKTLVAQRAQHDRNLKAKKRIREDSKKI